jgi:hypothetical protein
MLYNGIPTTIGLLYVETAGYAYRMECNFLLTRISSRVYHVFDLLFRFYNLDNSIYNMMLDLTRVNNNLPLFFGVWIEQICKFHRSVNIKYPAT